MKLTINNTAFFSACNDNDASFAMNALLSVREQCSGAKLFLIGKFFSLKTKRALKKHGIEVIEVDLTEEFPRFWEHPMEDYYLFAGPELLLERGYQYSVYLSSSVLCMKNPLFFSGELAGVMAAKDDSNVVYFNNQKMKNISLQKNASKIFKAQLAEEQPLENNNTLLAAVRAKILKPADFSLLKKEYNFRPAKDGFAADRNQLVFFCFEQDKPWKDLAYFHYDERYNSYNDLVKIWRESYKKNFFRDWLMTVPRIQKINKTLARKRRDKLARKGLMLSDEAREKHSQDKPIKLYWYRHKTTGLHNFGDEFSVELIQKLLGYNVEWADVDNCELMAIGSIIEVANNNKNKHKIKVWGSGFIKESNEDAAKNLDFLAVRGELTRARIKKDVPLGDPGVLASVVYPKSKEKWEKIGIIAHYIDYDLPIVRKLRKDGRFLVINPLESPEEVARQISSCKLILSSSLHGLIFADSFKVPNYHLCLSKRVTGGEYKFKDYCSGVGKDYKSADKTNIFDNNYLDALIKDYQPIADLPTIQKSLVEAFRR